MADLVTNTDMTGFPGAPYSDAVLEAAAESVRDDCGWHIAPSATETVVVEASGGVALLPSLRVTDVTEVRDAMTGEVLADWRVDKSAGVLHDLSAAYRRVEVDFTHGYDSCPPALKPVIAERAQAMGRGGYVRQESLGSRSVSLGGLEGGGALDALARYKLPPRP